MAKIKAVRQVAEKDLGALLSKVNELVRVVNDMNKNDTPRPVKQLNAGEMSYDEVEEVLTDSVVPHEAREALRKSYEEHLLAGGFDNLKKSEQKRVLKSKSISRDTIDELNG